MPCVYEYVCKKCETHVEVDRLLAENARHMVDKKVCGTLRRVWSSVNVNTVNLRKARR